MFETAREKIRARYAKDWRRPIRKGFLKIKTEDMQLVPLVPNEVQNELIDLIWEQWIADKPVRVIVPKPRREGISTISEAIIYSIAAFSDNYHGYLLGYNDENAREIFDMTKLMHDEMEISIRTKTKASNAKELVFAENHSKIVIGSAQNKEIRGKGIHAFHGSEVAFYPNPKATMGGLLQSIPDNPRTIIILESTGNGEGNWFEQQCRMAEKGLGEYTLFFIPWYRNERHATKIPDGVEFVPQITGIYGNEVKLMEDFPDWITPEKLYWRRNTIINKCGKDLAFFQQEYPATLDECFQASGSPVFSKDQLKKMVDIARIPAWRGTIQGKEIMLSAQDPYGWLRVWEKPVPRWRNRYVMGVDTGGVWEGADYSVAYVFDRVTRSVPAMIHGHFDAFDFARMITTLGRWYNLALIAIETNAWESEVDDMGNATIDRILTEIHYPALYRRKAVDDITGKITERVGWNTNRQTKQMIVDRLRQFTFDHDNFPTEYNDIELIEEMKTYIVDTTERGKVTWNAAQGCHDDRIMAFGITLCVSNQMPVPKRVEPPKTLQDKPKGLIEEIA